MLRDGKVATRLPAQDLDRARAFYSEKLGLEPVEEREGGLRYVGAQGEFALFASAGAASGGHTQLGWRSTTSRPRFAGTFSDDGNLITGHWELHDGSSWHPWMDVTLTKQHD